MNLFLNIKQWIPLIINGLVIILLCFVLAFLSDLSDKSLINIEIDVMSDDIMQLFWANDEEGFSENQNRALRLNKDKHSYWLSIDNFNESTYFRLDPVVHKTRFKINKIKIYSFFHYPTEIDLFNHQTLFHEIERVNQKNSSDNYAEFISVGNDPQIEITPFLSVNPFSYLSFLVPSVLLFFRIKALIQWLNEQFFKQHKHRLLFIKPVIIVTLLFFFYAFIGYLSTFCLLKIEMETTLDGRMKIFWANEKDFFSSEQINTTSTEKGRHVYWFWVNNFNKSTQFRIDPPNQQQPLKIYSIQLYSLNYYPIEFDLFNDIIPSNHIALLNARTQVNSYAELMIKGNDPQLEIKPIQVSHSIVTLIFLSLIVILLFRKKPYFIYIALLFSGLLLLYALLGFNESRLSFQVNAQQAGQIKLFWQNAGQENTYTQARSIAISKGQQTYTTTINNTKNVEVLFLEPKGDKKLFNITDLVIKEVGIEDLHFSEMEFIVNQKGEIKKLLPSVAVFLAIYGIIVWGIDYYLQKNNTDTEILPKLLKSFFLLATLLIFNLTWQADEHVHPDEHAHIEAVNYFSHYWDLPKIGDTRALDVYQIPWAVSRLDDLGVSYFFAGKFKNAVQWIFDNETFAVRAFSAFLFLILFINSGKKRLLFLAPLLCTPQIWYLYSYANRGSFVLFISLLLAWQLVNKKSPLNCFLNADKPLKKWYYGLFSGFLLGLLSIEQTNYLLFILFIFTVLLWELLFFVKHKKVFICQCLFFMSLGLSVFLVRQAVDVSINGFNKLEQRTAYAEEHAEFQFKPSIAATEQSYKGLRLREKGVTITEMFQSDWDWHKISFKSFTGLYGYYIEYSPKWYYNYVVIAYSIIILVVLRHALFQATWAYQLLTVLTIGAVSGGLLISFLFSWIYDFQPQGRYSFPIIPIILVYFWKLFPMWNRQEKALILASGLVLMILSFYSFNEVALNYLFS